MFAGTGEEMAEQVIDMLQLGSNPKFPIRRLVTIWKNERWRAITTRWCNTWVGRATFQLSMWDWMISYRVDEVSIPRSGAMQRS